MNTCWKDPAPEDDEDDESCDVNFWSDDSADAMLLGYVSDLDVCREHEGLFTYMGRVLARAQGVGITQRFLITWRRDLDDTWKEAGADTMEEAKRMCEVYVALEQ